MLLRDAPREGFLQKFNHGWLACDECKDLIERGDADALIERWATTTNPLARMLVEDRARREIGGIHRLFLEHKRGPMRLPETSRRIAKA